MGTVIRTDRFRRPSARARAKFRARFAQRRPWQAETERAMRDFERIVSDAHRNRRGGRR